MCTARALDDRELSASAGWLRRTGSGFYAGTFTAAGASRSGQSLSLSGVTADRLALVAEQCPGCGEVAVFIGRHRCDGEPGRSDDTYERPDDIAAVHAAVGHRPGQGAFDGRDRTHRRPRHHAGLTARRGNINLAILRQPLGLRTWRAVSGTAARCGRLRTRAVAVLAVSLVCLPVIVGLGAVAQATPGLLPGYCRSYAYACVDGGYAATAATTGNGWAWKYYGEQGAGGIQTPSGPHNCTLYVAWRLQRAGMGDPGHAWGDARQWGASLGYDHTPKIGSVAWWQGGDHVAYVEQINSDASQVFIRADNYVTKAPGGYTDSGWINADSPTGYLHPHDVGGGGGNPPLPDSDGDGIPDANDLCPTQPGSASYAGCPLRIGVITRDWAALVKEGPVDAGWVTENGSVAQVVVSGSRIAVLARDGTVYVKDGSLDAGWVTEESDAIQIALSGDRVGIVKRNGDVEVKEGSLYAGWVLEEGAAVQLSLWGNRIAVLKRNGVAVLKEGTLYAGWITEYSDVREICLSDSDCTDGVPPQVQLVQPNGGSTTRSSVRAVWRASDLQSGLSSYDLRYRRIATSGASTAWRYPAGLQNSARTSGTLALKVRYKTCVQVRARDLAGNMSAWTHAHCLRRKST
jgi:surface antigen